MNLRNLFMITLFSVSAFSQAAIVEGQDYEVLAKPVTSLEENKNKIELLEVFSYVCSHCRDLDPIYRNHLKKLTPDVATRTEHVVWGEQEAALAKISAAVGQTKTGNQLNAPIFKALFTDKVMLADPTTFQDWVKKQPNIDTQNFLNAYNSFGVSSDVGRMKQFTEEYKIDSTPRLVVGGKYQVILKGDFYAVMKVVDELIEKVRAERKMPDPKTLPVPKLSSFKILNS